MTSTEQIEENVKNSFQAIKKDMSSLQGTLMALNREIVLLKKVHVELSHRVSRMSAKKPAAKTPVKNAKKKKR